MVYSSEVLGVRPKNESSALIEDLNFFVIEIKLCELDLEKLIMTYHNYQIVLKQVEYLKNQFLIQENGIKNLKYKIRRVSLLTNSLCLPDDLKNATFYKALSKEVDAVGENLNELFSEFDRFKKLWPVQ